MDGEALTISVFQNCPESSFQKENALVQLCHPSAHTRKRADPASVHPRQNPSGQQGLDTTNGSRNYDAYSWQETHIGGTVHLSPG